MDNEKNGAIPEGIVSNKTPRRTFSVSKEFESILSDIDTMPNMSRFVCEAIKEKLERVKNPGKDIADALANFVQIQSIISQPFQTPQSLPQVEGNPVFTTSPSVPMAQEDTENKQEATPSVKKVVQEESTYDEPTVAEVVITKEKTPVKTKQVDNSPPISVSETEEPPNEDLKAKIRSSYFLKG